MDVIPFLSAVILISTIATILLAVLSYAAFKLRDKRKPKKAETLPVYFHRYLPDDLDDGSDGDESDSDGAPGAAGAELAT